MKYSIIIPVYNVEKYIKKCVQSVLEQTYSDFEILLVDDGSTDNSPAICDELSEKDERIKVIHKQNGGVSFARNEGIRQAKGDYILFLDADDYISKDLLEFCDNYAKNNSEINVFNYSSYDVCDNNQKILANIYEKGVYTFKSEKEKLDFLVKLMNKNYLITVCWRSCYKKEFILKNNLFFDEYHAYSEDVLYNLKVFMLLDSYVETGFKGYYHVLRATSCCGQNVGKIKLNELNEISYKIFLFEKQLNLNEFIDKHYLIHYWLCDIALRLAIIKKPIDTKNYANSNNVNSYSEFFRSNLKKALKKKKIFFNEFRPEWYVSEKCRLILLKYFLDNNKLLFNIRLFFVKISFLFTKLNAKIKRRLKGLFKK